MNRQIFAFTFWATLASSALAGLDRGGNVIREADDGSGSMWALLLCAAVVAFIVWRNSHERENDLMRAKAEIKEMKAALWAERQTSSSLSRKAEQSERMEQAVGQYLDGMLTDEEFFHLADSIRNQPSHHANADASIKPQGQSVVHGDIHEVMEAFEGIRMGLPARNGLR